MIDQNRQIEAVRADGLSLLSEDHRKEVVEGCAHLQMPYLPQSKEFIQKHILHDIEYPTPKAKLAQAVIELQVRLDALADHQYEWKKRSLEVEEVEFKQIEIEILASKKIGVEKKHFELALEKMALDSSRLEYGMAKISYMAQHVYNEFKNWKEIIEDLLKELNVSSVQEIDFSDVKMEQMRGKVKQWRKMYNRDLLQMTEPKVHAILAHEDAWNDPGKEQFNLSLLGK